MTRRNETFGVHGLVDFYESFRVERKRLKKTYNTCLFLYITGMVALIIGVAGEFTMQLPSKLVGTPLTAGIIISVIFIIVGDHYNKIAKQIEKKLKEWVIVHEQSTRL